MPGALVTVPAYGAKALAVRGAMHVYRNKRKYQAATQIARWTYRRYRKRQKTGKSKYVRRSARSIKSSLQRASTAPDRINAEAMTIRTLFVRSLVYPLFNPLAYNSRDKSIVHVRGFHICREFFHAANPQTGVGAIEVHWGLVQLKQEVGATNNTPDVVDYMRPEFFRLQQVDTSTTTTPFEDVTGTSSWDMKYNCLKLNPSRFHIITHRRKVLVTRNDQSQANGKYKWKIDKYFPVKKRVRFSDRTNPRPERPFFEVFWYNTVEPRTWPANPLQASPLETVSHHSIYYRG